MRSAVAILGLLAACGLPDDSAPPTDAAVGLDCPNLDENACLARADCHASYELFQCRNILGYCAEYRRCDGGQADCLGPASCERVAPFCAGPYVVSYLGDCYGDCVRADQCAGCRADKMQFTQATGCANDGSVELCIPPVLEHAIVAFAPDATCAPGGGRAGCDPGSQLLCQVPTTGPACTAPHGGLTDAAWDGLCAISMLPEVTAIVPTIFE